MTTEFDELDALPTEELRERAFTKAKRDLDVGFFWDLFRHMPTASETEERDPSDIGAAVEDGVQLWREFTGHSSYGENEPVIRARFIDYLTAKG